jgi:hypothetical protein
MVPLELSLRSWLIEQLYCAMLLETYPSLRRLAESYYGFPVLASLLY